MTEKDDTVLLDDLKSNGVENYGTLEESGMEKEEESEKEKNKTEVEIPRDLGNYFDDGLRKIDFVLVYEEELQKKISKERMKELEALDEKELSRLGKKKERFHGYRTKFLQHLKAKGVQFEEHHHSIEDGKKLTHFVKMHLPWGVLCSVAEDMYLHTPLRPQCSCNHNDTETLLSTLHIPNLMNVRVPNRPPQYYMCQFKKSKIDRFIGSENQETFFKETDRIKMAYELLSKEQYGRKERAEAGIERMVEDGIFTAAFPLHMGTFQVTKEEIDEEVKNEEKTKATTPLKSFLNNRQILYHYWAKWGKWFKYQPLDHIREYFGEKIGVYFAWLGFYTAWLLPASIVGLIIFIYGLVTMETNAVARETCDSRDDFKMCPLCDNNVNCVFWSLSKLCLFKKLSYLFDNPGTVVFSVFMSFWAVSFLEYWKRKSAHLAYNWDCLNFEEEEERPRAEYVAKCTETKDNPITEINEPYFPKKARIPRIISGLGVVIMMVCLVIIFIVAVIMYRVLITLILFRMPSAGILHEQASLVASISASFVNLIIILALSRVYEKLALKITQWEMHRTQTEFENQLTFKVFIFQFVNLYSSIIYIGFIKGKFVGYPGNYGKLLGLRIEECQNGDCLIELALNLAVVMVGKQIINNVQEVVVPKIKSLIHKWKIGKIRDEGVKLKRWEEDYELIGYEGLFQEYLEMVMQFGFITIFVAAFPLAPLFALLNNWIEIRLDAQKLVCETRRPVAEKAQNIGVWFRILESLAQLAVVSNAFLIAFTSEFLPKTLYSYHYNSKLEGYVNFTLAWAPKGTMPQPCRYRDFRDDEGNQTEFYWQLMCIRFAFIIIFEHIVFGICKLIDILVPDIPESLDIQIKKEQYLAKKALAESFSQMPEKPNPVTE